MDYKEDLKAYDRMKYYEYRERNLRFVSGTETPACVECGSTESLHFDHVDPSRKSFDVSKRKSLKSAEYREELRKCQVLCRACHEKKTQREILELRPFTHGTVYGFSKAKCHCVKCQEKKRAWNDERNASRRSGSSRGRYGRPSSHGEYLHYRRGCRCDLCRKANSVRSRVDRMSRQ